MLHVHPHFSTFTNTMRCEKYEEIEKHFTSNWEQGKDWSQRRRGEKYEKIFFSQLPVKCEMIETEICDFSRRLVAFCVCTMQDVTLEMSSMSLAADRCFRFLSVQLRSFTFFHTFNFPIFYFLFHFQRSGWNEIYLNCTQSWLTTESNVWSCVVMY